MTRTYYTKTIRPKKQFEKVDNTTITEQAYMPAQVQIERMILAGQNLINYKREMFDFGEDEPIDENYEDPSREPGFDITDAQEILEKTEQKILSKKEEIRLQKEIENDILKAGENNEEKRTSKPAESVPED